MDDTYMLFCPIDGCIGGINLHQLIIGYGSDQLKLDWNKKRLDQKDKNDQLRDGFEIPNQLKNRVPRGSNKPPLSDLERLRIKAMMDRWRD